MVRILIVEDDADSRGFLSEVLEAKGFSIETAQDARAAFDILEGADPYDLVVSDIRMPGMNGLELVRRIVEFDPTIVTVLLTGFTTESQILAAMRAGAFDFLSKPYTLRELDSVLTRALERRRVFRDHQDYRQRLEQTLEERDSEITGTNQILIELHGLGRHSFPLREISSSLGDFADYAMSHLRPDTFGVYVLEGDSFQMLVERDRLGRDASKALLSVSSDLSTAVIQDSSTLKELPRNWYLQTQNRWARCWPLRHDSYVAFLYVGYDHGDERGLDRHRWVFKLFRNRLDSYLKEHYMVRRHQEQLRSMFISSIQAHARSLEAKDAYTAGHCDRVDRYAELLAGQVGGFNDEEMFGLKVGSILHDIGKIGVPSAVLCKPGSLNDEERRQIQAHPVIGSRIVRTLYGFNLESSIRHHHEHFDGEGYPDGLKGDKIPMEARLILVADTFDAMTSNRPYQRGLSTERAVEELRKSSGKQFDPELVDVMIDAAPALEEARRRSIETTNTLLDFPQVV